MAKTVTITTEPTTTPTGAEGLRVTCNCGKHRNPTCIISVAMRNALAAKTADLTTAIHNVVGLANTPLVRAASSRATGPWTI